MAHANTGGFSRSIRGDGADASAGLRNSGHQTSGDRKRGQFAGAAPNHPPYTVSSVGGVGPRRSPIRDTKLVWAAATLCFFVFLRAGELTTPTTTTYDPNVHLCLADIAVDDPLSPF